MSGIAFHGVRKSFGAVEALKGIDLEIPSGTFTVFLGPSGCGKTTLMRVLAGLEAQTEGDVLIEGRVVNEETPAERGVGMVFQSYALYPHMTVRENLGFPLRMGDKPKAEIAARVDEVARVLQIEHLLDRRPSQLSGGQKQRVAIGRTVALDRRLFLFDEPLSNLDADLRVEMRLELQRLHRRLRSTMVYVTHDQVEALALADLIVIMRGGTIEQVGAPDRLYDDPANLFVATFLGSPRMNLLQGTVEDGGASGRIRLVSGDAIPAGPLPLRAGEAVTVGIRPEDLSVDSGDLALPFEPEMTEHLGANGYAYGRVAGARATVQLARRGGAFVAPEGRVMVRADALRLFGPDGARLRAPVRGREALAS